MKRFLAAFMAFLVMVLAIPLGAFSSFAQGTDEEQIVDSTVADAWDGKAASAFSSGNGTAGAPYVIRSAQELAYFARQVNAGLFGSSYVMLANNIDLSGYEWTPIGNAVTPFKGNFNGNGYTVTGVQITTTSSGIAGLFGYNAGSIANLKLSGFNVNFSYASANIYAGAVVGYNQTSGSVLDVEVKTALSTKYTGNGGKRVNCGGIAGYNAGTIGRCSYDGTINVTSNGSFVAGGIAGDNQGTIFSCYSMGEVKGNKTVTYNDYMHALTGGIAGGNSANITNCYSTADVSTKVVATNSNAIAGGLVGEAMSAASNVWNCYATGSVSANAEGVTSTAGGLIGYARGTVTNCYANNSVSALTVEFNASAGRMIGVNAGGTCTITNSYVNTSSSISRTYSYTVTVNNGKSGCGYEEWQETRWGTNGGASCTGETGGFSYSKKFITDTLKWGSYVSVSNHANNTNNTWIVGDSAPFLHIENIYSLTICYHKDGVVDRVLFGWKDRNEQYSVETPAYVGYTPDKTTVAGSMVADTITDVHYARNYHTLQINYLTAEGKSLGSYKGEFAYGSEYSITLPEHVGYKARESVIAGVMQDEDISVDTIYDANEYTLTVKYLYFDSNEEAASEYKQTVKYGESYAVTSPEIHGYTASQGVITGTMGASDTEVTVTYAANTHKISIIYQYTDGSEGFTDEHHRQYGTEFSIETIKKEGYTADVDVVSGIVEGDATYTVTYTPNVYTLTVEYVYASNGTVAAESVSIPKLFGEAYEVVSPELSGYTPSIDVVSGVMPSEDLLVSVFYGKNMYPLVITYQYEDGTLIGEETVKVEYDSTYSVSPLTIEWYTANPAVISGVMPSETVYVTVVYTRNVVNGGSGVCGEQANWILYEDGTLVISGSGDLYDFSLAGAPWYAYRDSIKTVQIEEGITSVSDHAFMDFSALTDCPIPSTVTRIGEKAFFGCANMTDITVPLSVEEIGAGAFSNCKRLTALTVSQEHAYFTVENGVLYNKNKTELICYPTGLYASSFDIPEGIVSVKGYAFYANTYLRTVTFPESLESIEISAFENCTGISQVQLVSDKIDIGAYAFKASALVTVIIDGAVGVLGDHAFDCTTIKSVYFKGNAPTDAGEDVFGTNQAVLERLCLYYPLDDESWLSQIRVVSDNGYKSEYWRSYHAYAYSGILDVTFANAGKQQVYAVFVYCDKTPISGVEVSVDGVTKFTDKDGFVYFVYENANKVNLMIHKDNYYSTYESVNAYLLKEIGVDYFNLSTDSSVKGVTCYGNDIAGDLAYINVKYAGSIPIVVQGTTAFEIEKMQIVQHVKDAKNASSALIPKVLQTIYKGNSALSQDGRCCFMIEASEFSFDPDTEQPIYVYMYTDSGEDVIVEELHIRTISFTFSGEFENLFGDVSLELSDTGVEFLDGIKINFQSPVDCPLSFAVVNNELYITWDMDDVLDNELQSIQTEVDGQKTNLKDAISNTETRVKNFMENATKKADEKLNRNKLFKSKHTSDFSLETNMAGGLCFAIGEENDLQIIRSYLKMSIELEASWTADYVLIFLPITLQLKANASGELEIKGLGFDVQNCEILLPEYSVTTEASIQMSLGIGNRVLSAGVFGRIKLTSTIVIGEVTYFDGLVLSGEYGIYAKLDVGLFSLYGEKSWKFMEVELIPKSQSLNLLDESETGYLGSYNGLPVYDLTSYTLERVSVDIEDVEWESDISQQIEVDSYEHSKAQLIDHDGETMVVYLTVDADRNSYNAQKLVYRIYDETTRTWSQAASVEDNGTSDSAFTVCMYNGKLYLAYTESDTVFADDYTLDGTQAILDAALSQEVVVCLYNEETKTFERMAAMTDNDQYESLPVLSVIDGQLYLAWCSNESRDTSAVFGTNSENSVWCASLEQDSWSDPVCLISDCNAISEMTLVELDGEVCAALLVDEDADYYTTNDSNIYIASLSGDIAFVDCFDSDTSELQACIWNDEPVLVWYCNGGLKYLSSFTQEPSWLLEEGFGITPSYKLDHLSEEISVITWGKPGVLSSADSTGLEISRIYGMFMDASGQWTDPGTLLSVPYYLMGYDLLVDDGDMRFVFTNTKMTINADTGTTEMYSKLCTDFLTTSYNFSIGEVEVRVDEEASEIVMNTNITNEGVKTIPQVSVMIKKLAVEEDGTVLTTVDQYYPVGVYELNLASGESLDVSFAVSIIEGLGSDNCEVVITVYLGTQEEFEAYVQGLNDALNSSSGGNSFAGVTEGGSIDSSPHFSGSTIVVRPGGGNYGSSSGMGSIDPIVIEHADLAVEGEYIIVGKTPYLSLKVTNCGDTYGSGVLTVVRRYGDNKEYTQSVYTANISSLAAGAIKYYLIELKQDLFDDVYETFECTLSSLTSDKQADNNSVSVIAKRLENADQTLYDELANASQLSEYSKVFDKYTAENMELSITLNGNTFVGLADAAANENTVYVPNEDHTVLHLTMDQLYLQTLDNGVYEYVVLFLTQRGYIDCVLNLIVQDTTPIDLCGEIAIVGSPLRGETLTVDTSKMNTSELVYEWLADGEVVSTESTFRIVNEVLDKKLSVRVQGKGLYVGSVSSEEIHIGKVARSVKTPVLVMTAENTVSVKKSFVVGDGLIEYGWAKENDAQSVENWSTQNSFTLSEDGLYFLFVRVTGSDIYADASSLAAVHGVNCFVVTWIVDDVETITAVAPGETPSVQADPAKAGNKQYSYTFAGWDRDGDGVSDEITAVTENTVYTALFDQTVNQYTVKWIVGEQCYTAKYDYGTVPEFTPDTTRPSDAFYAYNFTGWDQDVEAVIDHTVYTALYEKIYIGLLGDINLDTTVTIADVTELLNVLAGDKTGPADQDLTEDDQWTIADVTALLNILAG